MMHKGAYVAQPVPVDLRPFIRRFMVANNQTTISETVCPQSTGYSYLNWVIQGHWQAHYSDYFSSKNTPIFFSGQIKGEDIEVTHTGVFQHIVTEFTALGFYQLTGIKGVDCRNKTRSPDFFKPQLRVQFNEILKQSKKLPVSDDLGQHLRLLEVLLLTTATPPLAVPDYLIAGVEQIEQAHGCITIEHVCRELAVSQRQFSRRFTDVVGISPKYFARVLQMNKALQALLENDLDYICHIANEAGYYDESHFIHAIHHFFKSSPRQFLNSNQETLFNFMGKSRSFIITSNEN